MTNPKPFDLSLRFGRKGTLDSGFEFNPGDRLLLESNDFFLFEDNSSKLLLEPDGT